MSERFPNLNLELVGLDGNALVLLGAFARQAKDEGWTKDEINAVRTEAMSGDYNHLLQVLVDVTDADDDGDDADFNEEGNSKYGEDDRPYEYEGEEEY